MLTPYWGLRYKRFLNEGTIAYCKILKVCDEFLGTSQDINDTNSIPYSSTLAAFKTFSLILVFSNLTTICLGVVWASWMRFLNLWVYTIIKFGNILVVISPDIISILRPLLSLPDIDYMYVKLLIFFLSSLRFCSFFLPLYASFQIFLHLHVDGFFSVVSNLLLM